MAALYDLMFLIDSTAPEERRQEIEDEVNNLVQAGGTIVSSHDWGRRKITFEIDHKPEAEYRLIQFEGDNELLDQLNQRLRITDGLLRYRIIRQAPGAPPPPPGPEPSREASEAETDGRVAARAAADAAPDGAEEEA